MCRQMVTADGEARAHHGAAGGHRAHATDTSEAELVPAPTQRVWVGEQAQADGAHQSGLGLRTRLVIHNRQRGGAACGLGRCHQSVRGYHRA